MTSLCRILTRHGPTVAVGPRSTFLAPRLGPVACPTARPASTTPPGPSPGSGGSGAPTAGMWDLVSKAAVRYGPIISLTVNTLTVGGIAYWALGQAAKEILAPIREDLQQIREDVKADLAEVHGDHRELAGGAREARERERVGRSERVTDVALFKVPPAK